MTYGVEDRALSPVIGWTRIATGLIQGVLLWALTEASDNKVWPATSGPLFGVLAAVVLFTPFVVLAGIAEMRRRNVAFWALAVAVVVGLLGLHDVTRRAAYDIVEWLTPQMMIFTAAGLFIGHHLLEAGDLDDRLIARYPTYFDLAWKHGVQLAMSVGFVGVFWIVLMLGGALFKLIGVDFVEELIRKTWFAMPATTTMFAAAVQLTDVRHGLIRGIRTVALTLLSWLLPVLVFLAAAFMATLPFTGLDALWKTRSAAAILLSASAVMIILINAAYQDGVPDTPTPRVLRWAARLGGVLLIPLVGVAAYALCLRIGQYGLTPDRIIAGACVVAGVIYAVGYAVAAVLPGMWMKLLEATNVVAAFVVLGLLLAIFSPLADPARLSVNDQMARIADGRLKPDKVDYRFLRFRSERYGVAALKTLKGRGGDVGKRATEALAWRTERDAPNPVEPAPKKGELQALVKVWPRGDSLPPAFWDMAFENRRELENDCIVPPDAQPSYRCDAIQVDLNGDGAKEVVITTVRSTMVFSRLADDQWAPVGTLVGCREFGEALREGKYKVLPPPDWGSMEINGRRLVMQERYTSCTGGSEDATR